MFLRAKLKVRLLLSFQAQIQRETVTLATTAQVDHQTHSRILPRLDTGQMQERREKRTV